MGGWWASRRFAHARSISLDRAPARWYDTPRAAPDRGGTGSGFTPPTTEGRDVIADSTGIEHGRGDVGHPSPPPRHARNDADLGVECLRTLAADTRKALDAAHARCEALATREQQTRATLAEAQDALYARDAEYAETVRTLLDRLGELEGMRTERDAARRHALDAESSCRAMELRFEHVLMKIPRRFARKLRAWLTGAAGRTPNDLP